MLLESWVFEIENPPNKINEPASVVEVVVSKIVTD
jgi:hypothetical protein